MQPLQPIAARGDQLLTEARALSHQLTESNTALNKWMQCAKRMRKTWIAGLEYAIEKMRAELG